MARLEFDITGNVSGLSGAAGQAKGILASLQKAADSLTFQLFDAKSEAQINRIGGALQTITGKFKEYINEATKGSQAFKDQQISAALDTLNTKLSVITGNAQLFGSSLKNNEQQIKAYQTAINSLLSNGVDPLDRKIQELKANINSLTPAPPIITPQTLGLIEAAEAKLRDFQKQKKATLDTNEIARFNAQINHTIQELADLNNIGNKASQTMTASGRAVGQATMGYNQFGTALSYIVQDAPYAAYNFGAIGNNITQATAAFPGYIAQIRAAIVAQGGVATSAAVTKAALAGLVTGIGGVILAVSLVTTAFTIYQMQSQKAARATEEQAKAVQKQKSALDDYISVLDASSRASASAAGNYGQEVAKLDSLFTAIRRNTEARYGNGTAIQEIQKLYPEVFGSLERQEFLTNKASEAYVRLRQSIVDTAIAQAALKLSGDAAVEQVKNTVALTDAQEKAAQAQKAYTVALAAYNKERDKSGGGAGSAAAGGNGTAELQRLSTNVTEAKQALDGINKSIEEYRGGIKKAASDIQNFNNISQKAFEDAAKNTPKSSGLIPNLQAEIKRLEAKRLTLKADADFGPINKEIAVLQDRLDKLTNKGQKRAGAGKGSSEISVADQIRALAERTGNSSSLAGLEGYEEQAQRVRNTYAKLFADIASLQKQLGENTKLSAKELAASQTALTELQTTAEANQTKELSALKITEDKRVADEILRIRNEAGIKAAESRTKELAAIQAWYDEEIKKAEGNEDILAALAEGRIARVNAANKKYEEKAADLWFKIGQIEEQAEVASGNAEARRTVRIKTEWDKRRKIVKEAFDELRKLNASTDPVPFVSPEIGAGIQGFISNSIGGRQQQINSALDKGEADELASEFTKNMRRGIENFGSEFYRTLTSINEQADTSFGAIFSNLTAKFSQTINEILINQLLRGFINDAFSGASGGANAGDIGKAVGSATQKGVEKGTEDLGKSAEMGSKSGIIAGLAIAGAFTSGATGKSNVAGQTIGGALSGVASGAVIGTALGGPVIGTVIGGVVGAVGGLFGAKGAKEKEEDAQKKILEEQKKQTALLRQQTLAYSSAIIGRATDRGVVNAIEINEFGQLTATLSGTDIKLSYDRTTQNQKRGV